jgi:hypothetical protein
MSDIEGEVTRVGASERGSERVSKRRITEAKPKSIYKTSSSASPATSNAGLDYWRSNPREWIDHKIQFAKMISNVVSKVRTDPNFPIPSLHPIW